MTLSTLATVAHATLLAGLLADSNFSSRVLTISTGHLTATTSAALSDKANPLAQNVTFRDDEFGWSFHTSDEQEQAVAGLDGKHAELLALLTFARTAGYERLEFDADADTLPAAFGFPVFAW